METLQARPALKAAESSSESWEFARRLRCHLSAELAIPHFTVKDLLNLNKGGIVETREPEGARVPIWVNRQVIARGEFDVVGTRLAVRILELL